jgi:predicted GNAT family N-acyltransferase
VSGPDLGARVDALARAMVARAAPARFGVAIREADLTAAYRLRGEVVVSQGWAHADRFLDGLEHDAEDAAAVHVAGWDGDRVVATGRLVWPAPGRRLPTEAAFDLVVPGRERVADVGRVCVAADHRNGGHRVLWGLLGQTWIEMRRRGYQDTCCALTAPVARLYARLGFRVTPLAPARSYWGVARFPALVAPTAALARLVPTVRTATLK